MTIRSEHVERIRKCRSVPHDAGHDEHRPGLPRGRSRRRHAGTRFFRSRRAEATADLGEASEGVIHGRGGPDRSGQGRSRFSRSSQSCPTCSSSVHSGAPDRGRVCAHARASSSVSNDCWSMTAPSRSTIRKCFTPGIVPGEHSLRAAFGRMRRPETQGRGDDGRRRAFRRSLSAAFRPRPAATALSPRRRPQRRRRRLPPCRAETRGHRRAVRLCPTSTGSAQLQETGCPVCLQGVVPPAVTRSDVSAVPALRWP